jgi:mono/diheme cytochrome c family protein
VIRPTRLVLPVALGVALLGAGCGQGKITVSKDQPTLASGAKLFNERCSGCHSLDSADAYGSKPTNQIQGGERTNGPNFNQRKVKRDDVLFAIRNGGFSGAIMPANIVVGRDAQAVALFVERYAGKKAPPASGVKSSSPTGSSGTK